MKTKGIPFWEQHLEHLVLGVAMLAFLAIVAMQFIGSPNAVDVPQIGAVGPAEIDALLENNAKALADQLSPSAPSPVDLSDPTPVSSTFEQLRVATVSPTPQIVALAPVLNPVPEIGAVISGAPFVVASVPAPTELAQDQYFDALTDEVVEAIPELKVKFPSKPYDVMWTTVGARFNVAAVLAQFKKSGPNGEAPLPASWYNDRVDFIDVKLEREAYVDGKWANSTIVDPLPGLYSLRQTLTEKIDAPMRNGILAQVSDPAIRNQVIQPEFYDTKGGNWHPPVGADAVAAAPAANAGNANIDAEQLKIQELKDSLAKAKKERDRLLKKISESRCPPEAPTAPIDNKGGKGGAATGDQAPSAAGGGRGVGSGNTDEKIDLVECEKMRKRVRQIDRMTKNIEEELAKLEPKIEVDEVPKPEEEVKAVEVMPAVVDVWAHDMTVQPGHTYRYRLVVEMYNPLFAKKLDLPEAQQSLAEQFTLKSAPSEWTQPIEIGSWVQVFIVEATPAGAGGAMSSTFGQVKAEVFRFSDGSCWSERFTVQPGDRIGVMESSKPAKPGEAASPVDFSTEWFVLDVVENIDADKATQQRGWGASVILQNISKDDVSQVRIPQNDATSRELKRLRERVTLDKLGGAQAQAD